METAFDQKSITALMIGASAKLDVLWQIFILLHFGVFTLLLIHRTVLKWPGQLAAAIGYGFVMTITSIRVLDVSLGWFGPQKLPCTRIGSPMPPAQPGSMRSSKAEAA